jgi:hypothetical protein
VSDAFIREVDEDLRQKQLNNLWKKFGKFIIGAAVGIVLIVAGRAIYTNVVESKYSEQASNFSAALKQDEGSILSALDTVVTSDVVGYKIVATFKQAELAIAAGDNAKAISVLDTFIASADVPQIYKDMASIQASMLDLDTATTDQIRARLALVLNGDSGFAHLGEELIALSELKSGNVDAAKERFKTLTENVEVPNSVKTRAGQYLSVIE